MAVYLFVLLTIFNETLNAIFGLIGMPFPSARTQVWNDIAKDPARWPQLFLYSTTDDVISSFDVEDCIGHRRQRGVDVRSQCWSDSPHVQHLRHHREAYMIQCYQFLDDCLGNEAQGAAAAANPY